VALNVLFVGGTGQISLTSVREPVALARRNLELSSDTGQPNKLGHVVQDEDTLMDRIIEDQAALGSH
jgi:hypothetical protein